MNDPITINIVNMGATPSKQNTDSVVAPLDEKRALALRLQDASTIHDGEEMGQSLTADALDKWSKDFENVSRQSNHLYPTSAS